MVRIVQRMAKLDTLLAIRTGPGAAILPPQVTRLRMDFAKKYNDGHFGPRKFWRTYLPRLKYHNPAIPMTVNRTDNQEEGAFLTVYFNDTITSTEPQPSSNPSISEPHSSDATTRTEVIDMKHRHESQILSDLLEITNAIPVETSSEDLDRIKFLEERRIQGEAHSKRWEANREKQKQREAILAQARGELAKSRESA